MTACVVAAASSSQGHHTTVLAAVTPRGGDVISMGEPIKEKATGILFPRLCNGMQFAGCVSVAHAIE
jgi:hypothetical protein